MICIGDSIATHPGLGNALHCNQVLAVKGVPSHYIIGEAERSGHDNICVISAGSNDPMNVNLEANLEDIRRNVHCSIVVWVRPANRRASEIVGKVANEHGDKSVQVYPGSDGVHPKSYQELANAIKRTL